MNRTRRKQKTIKEVGALLRKSHFSPYLHILKAELILLSEGHDALPLKEAERAYLKAHKINPNDLEAIEGLAHYYDAVDPNPSKARAFAKSYLVKSSSAASRLRKILRESQ